MPHHKSIYLADPGSVVWRVTVTSNGLLQSVKAASGAEGEIVYLADSAGVGTVWLLGITNNGLLTTEKKTSSVFEPFVRLNDNWVLFVDANGILFTRKFAPNTEPGLSLELVAHVLFDTGTEWYSSAPLAGRTRFYEPKVIAFGDTWREVPVTPGSWRVADASIVLDDSDRHFTKLRASTNFYNREVFILVGDRLSGEVDFVPVFSGRIHSWTFRRNTLELHVAEDTLPRLSTFIKWRINAANFPFVPDATPRHLVPFVAGTVSNNTGAIPAYLVDAAQGQTKFRYVAAVFALKQVTQVYKYGVLQASGFAVSQQVIQSQQYTVIDFDVDPRDTQRPNEFEVTFNAQGITDDGLPSGNLLENPASILKEFLIKHDFAETDLDLTSFEDVRVELSSRMLKGAVVFSGEPVHLRTVLLSFAESFNLRVFPSREGQIALSFPSRKPSSVVGLVKLNDQEHVVREGLQVQGNQDLATAFDVETNYDWALQRYGSVTEVADITEQIKQQRKSKPMISLPYVRDSHTLNAVGVDRLFFLREERQVVLLEVGFELFRQLDIGDNILVTHYAGIASDGRGYRDTVFQILGIGLVSTLEAVRVRLLCVNLEEHAEPSTSGFKEYGLQDAYLVTTRIGNEYQYGHQTYGEEKGYID